MAIQEEKLATHLRRQQDEDKKRKETFRMHACLHFCLHLSIVQYKYNKNKYVEFHCYIHKS